MIQIYDCTVQLDDETTFTVPLLKHDDLDTLLERLEVEIRDTIAYQKSAQKVADDVERKETAKLAGESHE